jgi:hypothetical protein
VDLVIPEKTWDQKLRDVETHEIDVVVMGSDWANSPRFEHLRDHCEVVYLPRTAGTSTSDIRRDLLFEAIEYVREDQAAQAEDKPRKAPPAAAPPPPSTARLRSLGTTPNRRFPRPPSR